MDKYSIGLWLLTALMLATLTLTFVQRSEAPLIYAEESDTFIIGECSGGQVVFGWGNKAIGQPDALADAGCFNQNGEKLGEAADFSACRRLACNF